MTETERLLWNFVSGIRALARVEHVRVPNWREQQRRDDQDIAMQQTEEAVKELATYLEKINERSE